MVINQPKLKANVHLKIDGTVVRSDVAQLLRPDLVSSGIGDGRHGFEIDIGESARPSSRIDVTAGNADYMLSGSGKTAAEYGLG